MTRNHQVLIGGKDSCNTSRMAPSDHGGMPGIGVRIKFNPQKGQSASYTFAYFRCVLTDSSGKNQGIQTIQHCGVGAGEFGDLIAEHLHGEGSFLIGSAPGQQAFHVTFAAGNALQPTFEIQQPGNFFRAARYVEGKG